MVTITITKEGGEVFEEFEVKGMEAMALRTLVEETLVNARLCPCETCGVYVPEAETVEKEINLYCAKCAG